MKQYKINVATKSEQVKISVEPGLKEYLEDYARELGVSVSAGIRRLVLIGSKCELEHGHTRMPASYHNFLEQQKTGKPAVAYASAESISTAPVPPEPDLFLNTDWSGSKT